MAQLQLDFSGRLSLTPQALLSCISIREWGLLVRTQTSTAKVSSPCLPSVPKLSQRTGVNGCGGRTSGGSEKNLGRGGVTLGHSSAGYQSGSLPA